MDIKIEIIPLEFLLKSYSVRKKISGNPRSKKKKVYQKPRLIIVTGQANWCYLE